MLGRPRLINPDGVELRCDRKPLAALAYLALEGPTTRSRLAGLLWPETLEGSARNNLVQLIRRMNRMLGADLILAEQTVHLHPDVQVDFTSAAHLEPQGDLSRTTLLEGVEFDDMPDFADWLAAQREQLDTRRAASLLNLAQQQEAEGSWAAAIATAQALLTLNQLSEDHHRRLMRLYYLNNDRAAALSAYQRCRELLEQELGVEPMPETQHLAKEIEQGQVELTVIPQPPQLPLALRHPTVLAGRSAAWAALEAAWARGQFIILSGEPGVGKSRLMHDFVARKGPVLRVEARPGDAHVPYATTARNLRGILATHPEVRLKAWQRSALAPLLPELLQDGDPPAPVPAQAALHAAIQDLFQIGARGAVAVVYEDLHYADPAAIEAGLVLISSAFPLGQPDGVPHMLCTVRHEELSPQTAAVYDEMIAHGLAVQIALAPLTEAEAHTVLEHVGLPVPPELRTQLAHFSGGNPLFLLEMVRHLVERGQLSSGNALPDRFPVPEKVQRIIERRLARLSPGALNTARAASVLQSDFHIELIAQVLGAPILDVAQHWEELENAQLMTGSGFAHDVVYESILSSMPLPVRRLLHRSAARALSHAGAPPARIAAQWQLGGNLQAAAALLEQATVDARQVLQPEAVRQFLATAIELYGQLGADDQAARLRSVLDGTH